MNNLIKSGGKRYLHIKTFLDEKQSKEYKSKVREDGYSVRTVKQETERETSYLIYKSLDKIK